MNRNAPFSSQLTGSRVIRWLLCAGCGLAIIIFLVTFPIMSLHSSVRKIVQSSKNRDLHDIAEENNYNVFPVLDKYMDYIQKLDEKISELTAEKDELSIEVQNLTAEIDRLNQGQNTQDPQIAVNDLFISLFTGEARGNGAGVVCKNEADDTISYLNFVPKSEDVPSEPLQPWKQYDRIEVDMYKRTGDWHNDIHQLIVAALPDDFEGGAYRVRIFLRTDASRINNREKTQANGGTVALHTRDQKISTPSMRLNNKESDKLNDDEEDKIFNAYKGDTITLDASPEDDTHFFSYAICVKKDVPQTEGGSGNGQN